MATIEPRLIHLLNESTATPRLSSAELPGLPPINGLSLPKPPGRPHTLPYDPDASQRADCLDSAGDQLTPQQSVLPLLSADSIPAGLAPRKEGSAAAAADRSILHHVSSQDLRMILDDAPEGLDDSSAKKRPVVEDFVQLPQPLKKQKAASQPQPLFPPIIVGLCQDPNTAHNRALFPPILSGSFDDRPYSESPQALSLGKPPEPIGNLPDEKAAASPTPDSERSSDGKAKRRAAKPRKKWSEEETNHLLLGVSKHGVGRWTDILEDLEYHFNGRSAGDLKDRFRTCCPEELRAGAKEKTKGHVAKSPPVFTKPKPKKGLMSENILNEPDDPVDSDKAQSGQNDSDSAPRQRKSRAHRKKLEDLVELGIKGPFKKSQRRGRRPFSEQDDREILQGFELYGPQWTKIQRDPQFNLSTRQPTDLRDRLRNKYPEKFANAEKAPVPAQEPARQNNLLEPSVEMSIENSLNRSRSSLLEPQLDHRNSKEDMPKWPLASSFLDTADAVQAPPSLFWNEATGAAFPSGGIGEMGISRLLLDDTQIASEPLVSSVEKRGPG